MALPNQQASVYSGHHKDSEEEIDRSTVSNNIHHHEHTAASRYTNRNNHCQ